MKFKLLSYKSEFRLTQWYFNYLTNISSQSLNMLNINNSEIWVQFDCKTVVTSYRSLLIATCIILRQVLTSFAQNFLSITIYININIYAIRRARLIAITLSCYCTFVHFFCLYWRICLSNLIR